MGFHKLLILFTAIPRQYYLKMQNMLAKSQLQLYCKVKCYRDSPVLPRQQAVTEGWCWQKWLDISNVGGEWNAFTVNVQTIEMIEVKLDLIFMFIHSTRH